MTSTSKASRIVRLLLHDPHTPRQAKVISQLTGVSYAYTSNVLRKLELRCTTPHNFLVLRSHPHAETDAGGIFFASRELAHGSGVSLPQLAVDFANVAGPLSSAAVRRYARLRDGHQ